MTEKEMFEKSFQRPKNFFNLDSAERYTIDENLGILDWQGYGFKQVDKERFNAHYK